MCKTTAVFTNLSGLCGIVIFGQLFLAVNSYLICYCPVLYLMFVNSLFSLQ